MWPSRGGSLVSLTVVVRGTCPTGERIRQRDRLKGKTGSAAARIPETGIRDDNCGALQKKRRGWDFRRVLDDRD